MTKDKKYKPSLELMILDSLGAILVGLGLFEWFSGSSMVPDQYKFENYHVTMVVAGVILMLPALFHLVAHYAHKKNRQHEI